MSRVLTVAAVALGVLLVGAHVVFASPCPSIGCGGLPHSAPAPLLAAGIPAFTALGGGVLFSRLARKFKRRPQPA